MTSQKPTHEVHLVKNNEGDWLDYRLAVGEVVHRGSEEECFAEAEILRAEERALRPADSLGYRYVVHPYGTTGTA